MLFSFFSFFSFFPFFPLGTLSIVHNLLEDVAVARTDKPRKVNVTRTEVIHRTCPGATPVVTDIAYHWHQYREIFVPEVLRFEHTVAETSMLEALVVCWALVPKRGSLLDEFALLFFMIFGTVGLEMSSLTTVPTAPLHSQ